MKKVCILSSLILSLSVINCTDQFFDFTEETRSLPSFPPTLAFFEVTIPEDTPVGSQVGIIEVLESGNRQITAFTLSDTADFEVNELGEVRTKTYFDRDQKNIYYLTAFATNEAGDSENVDLLIRIGQAVLPKLGDVELNISETVSVGELIGQVPVITEGESRIRKFLINDEQAFEVNQTGELRTKTLLQYDEQDHYQLEVSAVNEQGEGNRATINVYIHDKRITMLMCDEAPLLFMESDIEGMPMYVSTSKHSEGINVEWCPGVDVEYYEVKYGEDESLLTD